MNLIVSAATARYSDTGIEIYETEIADIVGQV